MLRNSCVVFGRNLKRVRNNQGDGLGLVQRGAYYTPRYVFYKWEYNMAEYEKLISAQGTKLTGFVSAEENMPPRECRACIFYKHDTCHHPLVQIDPDVPGEHGKPKPVEDEWCCNFFRSQGRTLFYVVRHGETELNAENAYRGWADVPLDENGRKQAKEAAEYLKGKGIRMVYCSDLVRAKETAVIICKVLGLSDPWVDFRLRPWDVGDLTGQEKTKENKATLEEYADNTSWQIPGGESVDEFGDRVQDAIDYYAHEAREEGIKLLVTHTSDCIQVDNWTRGEGADGRPEVGDVVEPGGILKITEKNGKLKSEAVLGATNKAEYGTS